MNSQSCSDLKLTDDNKETFEVHEEVTLRVELKNIDKLFINIYEFDESFLAACLKVP